MFVFWDLKVTWNIEEGLWYIVFFFKEFVVDLEIILKIYEIINKNM